MKPEPELIPLPPTWLLRSSIKHHTSKFDKRKFEDTIVAELIYGSPETCTAKNGVTITEVHGDTYHVLNGPTAEASISEMAKRLNERKFVPDEAKKLIRTRADGWTQSKDCTGWGSFTEFALPETYLL